MLHLKGEFRMFVINRLTEQPRQRVGIMKVHLTWIKNQLYVSSARIWLNPESFKKLLL